MGPRKIYQYLVAYFHSEGLGRCLVERSQRVTSFEDILKLEAAISFHHGLEKVGVTSYQWVSSREMTAQERGFTKAGLQSIADKVIN